MKNSGCPVRPRSRRSIHTLPAADIRTSYRGEKNLYEAEALIPIDEYWEEYPNIRQYMTNEQWDMLRQEDGHIYWIPQFGVTNGKSSDVIHDGEAFWIQTRV